MYKLPLHILHYVEYNKSQRNPNSVLKHNAVCNRIPLAKGLREKITHFSTKRASMSKELKFNFNPFKEGLNHVLGTLETDIMEVLWKQGESSVKDILDAFPADKDISYSAVITVTNRMTKKGLLKKRKMGKAYLYNPIYDKERFYEIVSKKVVDGISGFSLKSAMVHFVDYMSHTDQEKMEYFSKLIESKRQKQLIQKEPPENTKKR